MTFADGIRNIASRENELKGGKPIVKSEAFIINKYEKLAETLGIAMPQVTDRYTHGTETAYAVARAWADELPR